MSTRPSISDYRDMLRDRYPGEYPTRAELVKLGCTCNKELECEYCEAEIDAQIGAYFESSRDRRIVWTEQYRDANNLYTAETPEGFRYTAETLEEFKYKCACIRGEEFEYKCACFRGEECSDCERASGRYLRDEYILECMHEKKMTHQQAMDAWEVKIVNEQ